MCSVRSPLQRCLPRLGVLLRRLLLLLVSTRVTQKLKGERRREKFISTRATVVMRKLFKQFMALERTTTEMGTMMALPPPKMVLPREKPIPPPKKLSKWEKFAQTKDIQNRKRERMVWDDDTNQWRPRWGYKRDAELKDWIVELKPGEVGIDQASGNISVAQLTRSLHCSILAEHTLQQHKQPPQLTHNHPQPTSIPIHPLLTPIQTELNHFQRDKLQKEERIVKNKKQRLKNAMNRAEDQGDVMHLPEGIPVATGSTLPKRGGRTRRGMQVVSTQLERAQRSTASMGKFDDYQVCILCALCAFCALCALFALCVHVCECVCVWLVCLMCLVCALGAVSYTHLTLPTIYSV